jgi:catechol 2,3-dioxygenase-like lactoylglutathione lyase family enzyme
MRLNHVHIPVTDLARAVDFYRDSIGLGVGFQSDVMADLPEAGLVLDQIPEGDVIGPGLVVGLMVEDVDAAHASLLQRGVVPEGPPADQPWGVRNFYVSDPDGNTLEFEQAK